jgi:hypothetical protein
MDAHTAVIPFPGARLPDRVALRLGLTVRWQRANARLAAALTDWRAFSGRRDAGNSDWVAAQLRLAEARQRAREAADELAAL